jgi:hypothetical protein
VASSPSAPLWGLIVAGDEAAEVAGCVVPHDHAALHADSVYGEARACRQANGDCPDNEIVRVFHCVAPVFDRCDAPVSIPAGVR